MYLSAARDEESQDDFFNAVARVETDESPEEIHEKLNGIEEELGKDPPYKKGPRTIDLDILIYEDSNHKSPASPAGRQITNHNLIIPHPRMHERRFVLEPLCELCDNTQWQQCLEKTLDQSCEKTDLHL